MDFFSPSMLVIYARAPETWVALAFGLVIGSFLNVCILRIPKGELLKKSRSHCPHCDAPIPFYLNIPVLSYMILLGKARCCGRSLSLQYPLVEAFTGFIFVVVYWQFPFVQISSEGVLWLAEDFLRFLHLLIFACLLIVISVIDIRLQIIPDAISLPMIAASGFWVAIHPSLDWFSSLLGVLLGGGILYAVAWLYVLLRKEYGLGFGDVKLLAAIGGWLGAQAILPTLFIGSVLGAVFGVGVIIIVKKAHWRTRVPFGPFLALGAFLYMILGTEILGFFGGIP